jgi:hypothetical protein
MNEPSKDAGKLRMDFYKNLTSFALTTLGVQITLLQSLFKDFGGRGLAYVSVLCVVFSCLGFLGAQEALVNRLDPLQAKARVDRLINRLSLVSATAERVISTLSGILYGAGIAFFVVFALDVL